MNKFLLAILLFVSSAAIGQRVYSPSVDGVPGRNQPVGITGQPLDGRNQYHDTTISPAKWRDFQSTAEAIAYFNTATKRTGGFEVFVHSGGTLSGGVWTGGTRTIYFWKDGVADGDLVVKGSTVDLTPYTTNARLADTANAIRSAIANGGVTPTYSGKFIGNGTSLTPLDLLTSDNTQAKASLFKARFFGDSMTYGTGSDATDNFTGGTPFMEYVQASTGLDYFNYGIPGQTSSQIETRFYADSANKYYPTVFFAGTNDGVGAWAAITARIQNWVNSLGHTRYLVIVPPGQNTASFYTGGGEDISQHKLDSALTARFPGHVIHVKERLIAAATPNSPDTFYTNRGVWPARFGGAGGSDPVHLNDLGSRIGIANGVINLIDTLRLKKVDEKIVSTYTITSIKAMMSETVIPQKRVAIGTGASTFGDYWTDAAGNNRQNVAEIKGNVAFKIPGTNDGLWIRSLFSNEGGSGNVEIAGTNQGVWPVGSGISIKNHTRDITIGKDAATVNLKLKGNIETTGQGTFGNIVVGNGITFNGPLTNTNPRTGLVFDLAGSRGGVVPNISESVILAIGGGGPYTTGTPYQGEIGFNTTRQRLFVGWNKNDPYTAPGYVPFFEDLDAQTNHFAAGAGIEITGNGTAASPKLINNTTLPPSTKFTGTLFESPPTGNTAGFYKEAAFDGIDSTRYQSVAADVNPSNYVGMTLDTAKIITLFRYRPADGISVDGAKLQGSNTSTTAGFVDLFTIPSGTPYYQYSQTGINSLTAYKYYRILQSPGSYVLAMSEIQFYGYKPAAAFTLTTDGEGAASLVGSNLNIPISTGSDSGYVAIGATPDSSALLFFHKNRALKPDTFAISGATAPTGGNGVWGQITGTLSNQTDLAAALAGKQPIDADLTTIAGLTALTDNFMVGVSNAWASRTIPQVKATLSINNVDNTSDANKPVSTAQAASIATKQNTLTLTTSGSSGAATLVGATLNIPQYSGGTGLTQSQVSQIVKDSLDANAYSIKNIGKSGYDTLSRKTTAGLDIKSVAFNDTQYFTWNKNTTDSTISLSPTVTLPFNYKTSTRVSNPTLSIDLNGGPERHFIYQGPSNATWTFPTLSNYNGMFIEISNTTSFNISVNVTVYDNDTLTTAPGAVVIGPLGMAHFIKDQSNGNWYRYTTR